MSLFDYLNHILQSQGESMSVFGDVITIFVLPIIMINRLMRIKSINDYYRTVIIYGGTSLSFNFFMLWYGTSLSAGLDKFLRFSGLFNTFVVLAVIAIVQVTMLCLEKHDLRKKAK